MNYLHGVIGTLNEGPIVRELLRHPANNDNLRRMVQSSDRVDWSPGAGQKDCADFCQALIQSLIAEAREDGGGELVNIVTMMKRRSMRCTQCQTEECDAVTEEWILTPVSIANTLEQGFQTVLAPVRPNFLNECRCSNGALTTYSSVVTITKYPAILIIHLGRFPIVRGSFTKNESPVTVPLRWQPTQEGPPMYLRAACLHEGPTIEEGHYFTIIFGNENDGTATLVNRK